MEIIPGDWSDWSSPQSTFPSADTPFLLESGNLGIPHKVLKQLYTFAARYANQHGFKDISLARKHTALTSIILLANGAHQTALNTRKRLIQQGVLPYQKEWDFCRFLLLASKDGSKQSIIWDYRWWLLKSFRLRAAVSIWAADVGTKTSEVKPTPIIPREIIADEFKLVRRACTIYPRNYHAWNYWRRLMETIHLSMTSSITEYEQLLPVVVQEFQDIDQWIQSHVSDFTAMHQFCATSECFFALAQSCPQAKGSDILLAQLDPLGLAQKATSLLHSYPNHESLWIYARLTLTRLADPGSIPLPTGSEHVNQIRRMNW